MHVTNPSGWRSLRMMETQRKREWTPPRHATDQQIQTLEGPLPSLPGGAQQVDSPCRLRKRVQHSLFFTLAATTFGVAFFITLLLGLAWLLRADMIFLK
jgi:hypothetical protein